MQEMEQIPSRADLEVGIAKIVGKCSGVKGGKSGSETNGDKNVTRTQNSNGLGPKNQHLTPRCNHKLNKPRTR